MCWLKGLLDKAHKGLKVRQACISGIVDNFLHGWHENSWVPFMWYFMDAAAAFSTSVKSTWWYESSFTSFVSQEVLCCDLWCRSA